MRKQRRLLEDLATRRQPGRWPASNLALSPPAGRPRDATAIAAGLRDRGDIDLAGAERYGAEGPEAERIAAERLEAERIAAERLEAERIAAERLVADVAALLDAGLVVVQSRALGPARYAVSPDREDAA